MFGSTFIIFLVVAGISSSSIPACYTITEKSEDSLATCDIAYVNHSNPNEPFDFTNVPDTETTNNHPFTHFESLQIRGVMKYVPNNVFIQFSNLKNLQISDCSLQQIKRDDFKNAQKLIKLDLEDNHLTIIENYTFTGAENIEELGLSYNNIKVVEQLAFVNLLKLKELDLKNNSIQHLDANIFATNLNIETLKVDGNEIENLDFIQPLVKIETLHADRNRIASINRNLLDDKTKLDELHLRDNCFSRFEFDALPKNMIFIYMSDNYLDENSLLKLRDFPLLMAFNVYDNNVNCTIERTIENAIGKSQYYMLGREVICQHELTYRAIKDKCKGKVMDMTETMHLTNL